MIFERMKIAILLSLLLLLNLFIPLSCVAALHDTPRSTSIIFTTLGRAFYAFDIYALPALGPPKAYKEIKVTDGQSVNFNGQFPSPSSSSFLLNLTGIRVGNDPPPLQVVYVTERDKIPNIYYDAVYFDDSRSTRKRSALESITERVQVPLLANQLSEKGVSMKDKPTVTGEYLVYVSTHEDPGVPRASWAAVYSTHLKTGQTRRLTPYGIADFSPAISPSGTWTAVASYGAKGWTGEVEELTTDIYVFLTRDGTQRVKVVENGGWPCWVDDHVLFFHRKSDDQWWSVYRASLPTKGPLSTDSVKIERVTPPGLHSFTPATSPGNHKFIALATRRQTSSFRHIELFDLEKKEFKELTRLVSPRSHHLNPFISPDSYRVGYHRCRGKPSDTETPQFLLENVRSPVPGLSLFRFIGSFPSFSPSGDRIAYVEMPGVYVVNPDGSNRRKVLDRMAFSAAWDPVRPGIIYTSSGPTFASESSEVDIISIDVDNGSLNNYKRLTHDGKNNAFPSPSPDGKWIVFRSGRSGHKNLYIMDVVEGERGGLRRLTEGPWTDTMCNWSPDGEWIAFASDRDNPGSGSFELYLIHPDGTGLRKLIQSGSGGRTNHPYFSPDSQRLVFTSDYGGISAEPISNPHHYQPYGEIFTIKLDGSDIKRLTHNSYEDGTPAWSPKYIKPINVEYSKNGPYCTFEDCHWLNTTKRDALLVAATTKTKLSAAVPQCGV